MNQDLITSIKGVRIAAIAAEIRKPNRLDLTLFELAKESVCAICTTKNTFPAAPILIARQHLSQQMPSYWLINTGYANAGTGNLGEQDAMQICDALAEKTFVKRNAILPFSTGIIGERLPVTKISNALDELIQDLQPDHWNKAAQAILTTDTHAKLFSESCTLGETTISLLGISKGAGMIKPNMATMLSFIATDLAIDQFLLTNVLRRVVDQTFNRITIDGDTSTNDAVALVATKQSNMDPIISAEDDRLPLFEYSLNALCLKLALAIVKDGEGVTKCVFIEVKGGRDKNECQQVAEAIAHSPLVKTAWYASDPNWGRMLAAIGRSGIDDLDPSGVELDLDDVAVVRAGAVANHYEEKHAADVLQKNEFTVSVRLGRGNAIYSLWTTDLSHAYVSINADYRS
ncbi:MAG: bifunctional glutamate N-acetyltransferase/amino-acid acetyltransferase ArgJ [Pseudomonadota bacterium]